MQPTVWSVCFVWPDGMSWDESPSTYLGCMQEWILRRRRDTVIVYLHERIPQRDAISDFLQAVGRAVHVRLVKGHAFVPMTMRFAPLFDLDPLTTNAVVIVADVHDDLAIQTRLIARLMREMQKDAKGFGLTAWRASGNGLPYACDALRALDIPPTFRFRSERPGEYHWHVDGGLLIATFAFRMQVTESFVRHVAEFTDRYGHARGADEPILETFFHQHGLHSLFLREACAFPHVYRIRVCKACSRAFEGTTQRRRPAHRILFEGAYENENPQNPQTPKPCRFARLVIEPLDGRRASTRSRR